MDEARRLSERIYEILNGPFVLVAQCVVIIASTHVDKKPCSVSPSHLVYQLFSLAEIAVHVTINDVLIEVFHFIAPLKSFQIFLCHNLEIIWLNMKGRACLHTQPDELFFLTFVTDAIVDVKVSVSRIIILHALLVVSVAGACIDDVIKSFLIVAVDVRHKANLVVCCYFIHGDEIPQLV